MLVDTFFLLSEKSKELLPCQLPLVANKDNELRWVFPSWYFDLDWDWAGHYTSVSPIATSTINPTDRCDNFLIFLHVGTGRREPNVSLHHLFSRHFAGGGRRKKFRKNLSQLQNWTFHFEHAGNPSYDEILSSWKGPAVAKVLDQIMFLKVQKYKLRRNLQVERWKLSYWPTYTIQGKYNMDSM